MASVSAQSDPDVNAAIKRINDRFIRLGKGTPVHEVKTKLGTKRSVLDEIVKARVLQVIHESYFPTLVSIQMDDEDTTQLHCRECTTLVLNVLKRLYGEFGARTFSQAEILEAAKTFDRHAEADCIRTGMLFATDFSRYRGTWSANDGGVASLIVNEDIIDFNNFESAWAEEQRMRNSQAADMGFIPRSFYEPPSPLTQGSAERRGHLAKDGTKRNVFVIHGRNLAIRDSVFALLRALDLNPLEWSSIVSKTGKASPYVGEILETGFRLATAVVAVLTPDDVAYLHPDFISQDDPEYEKRPTGQARPNVLFETGMALASHPERTVLIEIGKLRPFSDVAGRHSLKFDGSPKARHALTERLRTAGCELNTAGEDWLSVGDFRIVFNEEPSMLTAKEEKTQKERPSGWFDKAASVERIQVQRSYVDEPSSVDRYFKIVSREGIPRTVDYSTHALLAAFRISNDSPSNYAKLTARIDFIDESGKVLQRVDRGSWVGEVATEISISRADTLYLVIVIWDRYSNRWVAVDDNPAQVGVIKKPLALPCKAKITLLVDDRPTIYPEIVLTENMESATSS